MRTQLVVFCPHTFDDFQHIVFFRFRRIQCMHSKTVGNFLAARFGNFLHMRMNGNDEVFSFNTLGDHFTSFFSWHAHCHYTVAGMPIAITRSDISSRVSSSRGRGAVRADERVKSLLTSPGHTTQTFMWAGSSWQNIAHTQYAMLAGRVNAQPPTDIAQ